MTLPAFAAERKRLHGISIDSWNAAPAPAAVSRYLLPQGAQQQTSRTPLLLSIDATDRRTGHLTVTYYGGSVKNKIPVCNNGSAYGTALSM